MREPKIEAWLAELRRASLTYEVVLDTMSASDRDGAVCTSELLTLAGVIVATELRANDRTIEELLDAVKSFALAIAEMQKQRIPDDEERRAEVKRAYQADRAQLRSQMLEAIGTRHGAHFAQALLRLRGE